MTKPTFGSLFCGGGVQAAGAMEAGAVPLWGVEYCAEIAGVYRDNFDHPVHVKAVQDCDPRMMEPVDMLFASPVCTRFSQANVGGAEAQIDIDAAAGVCEFIKAMLPKVFIMENVWGYRNSKSFAMILEALHDRGYFVDFQHLCSADFGVPQTRNRLILRAAFHPLPMIVPTHADPAKLMGASLFEEARAPWIGWYEAIEDLIPGLPESELADWQKKRLPAEYANWINASPFIINGREMHDPRENNPVTARGHREPVFTVSATGMPTRYKAVLCGVQGEAGELCRTTERPAPVITACHGAGKYRAILIDGDNAGKLGPIYRDGGRRSPTISGSSKPKAILVADRLGAGGKVLQLRKPSEPSHTVTCASASHPTRAIMVHATDMRSMPVRHDREHRFTVMANSGEANKPRAVVHGSRTVKMTVEALGRFQSVPAWYRYPENTRLATKIIGNGWPSLMAQRITEQMMELAQ